MSSSKTQPIVSFLGASLASTKGCDHRTRGSEKVLADSSRTGYWNIEHPSQEPMKVSLSACPRRMRRWWKPEYESFVVRKRFEEQSENA
jgi:hypothetical protein